jgi:hypothetical protein
VGKGKGKRKKIKAKINYIMVYGGIITNFIGAVIRWIYGTIWRTVAGKHKYKFREYLNGPENSDDFFDNGHEIINSAIGVIALLLLCALLIKFG